MAKRRLATGYTFVAASKTITHADFSDIGLAGIQVITNVTDQIIIYNFADTAKGGTLATDTLTLEYDTTTMSDSDELMILVEDGIAATPVSATSLPLPTGAATLAEQQTQTASLSVMDDWDESDRAKVNPIVGQAGIAAGSGVDGATVPRVSLATNVPLPAGTNNIGDVDVLTINGVAPAFGSGVRGATVQRVTVATDDLVPISAASLPLPTGAATAALQTQPGVDIGDVTINNAAGASAVNVQDGGNSLTVDNGGTFSVQDSQVITDNAAFTDGTSKVFAAGYIYDEVAGTALTENDAAAARINVNRAQVQTIEDGTTRGRYATVTASNALKTDGSAVTQPVSAASLPLPTGAATAALQTQPGVDIGDVTINNASGASAVNIQDGGNSITIDGSVTANAGTGFPSVQTEDAASAGGETGLMVLGVRNDAAASKTSADGDFSAIATDSAGRVGITDLGGSLTVDNGGTFSVQITADVPGTGATNLGKAEDAAHTTGDTGVMGLGVRRDTPTTMVSADGDYHADTYDANGAKWVSLATKLDATNDTVGVGPQTTGGLTTYHLVSAGSTNASSVKASAGQLYGWYIYNSNAAARKVAFHNTAGTPTAGASVFFSLVIPPSSGANVFSTIGMAFSTGIGITTVTGLADSDTAAVAANDLIINLFYK